MGLCKCPRKKVTNLFCFQHKVNVCEHCVVASHPKCIVQSYLRWLRDSDFRPVCTICNVGLEDDDAGECVRLMCFDVFHWRCLDRLCRTVPAGGDLTHYKCPSCQTPVFPADNVVSPLAEALRAVLSGANWARSGLGLPEVPSSDFDVSFEQTGDEMSGYDPSISYDEEYNMSASSDWLPNKDNYDGSYAEANQQKSASLFQTSQEELSMANGDDHVITMSANDVEATMRGDPPPHYDKGPPKRGVAPPAQMNGLHKVHGGAAESHGYDGYGDQRSAIGMRNIDSHFRVTSGAVQPPDSKEHDDKYRRRTPALWTKVNNWPKFRRFVVTISTYKLFILVIFLCLVGFILVDSFIKYGRTMADKEPFLDPMANPNIRVNSQ